MSRGGKTPHLYSPVVSTLVVCDTRNLSGIEESSMPRDELSKYYLEKQLRDNSNQSPYYRGTAHQNLRDKLPGLNKTSSRNCSDPRFIPIYFLMLRELIRMVLVQFLLGPGIGVDHQHLHIFYC